MSNKVQPPKGRMPVLQFVPPVELTIDPAYQRSIDNRASQRLISRIAQQWDWALCLPLVVSARDNGAALFVIDGQHRLEAAKLRGDIAQLPCVVLHYAGANEEAASFVELNERRQPLSALDLFRASLASGDDDAQAVFAAIEDAGLTLATHLNTKVWKPGMIGNIGGIRTAWRRHGAEATQQALRILSRAYEGQIIRYAGKLFPGIASRCEAGDTAGLVTLLRSKPQEEWARLFMQARADHPNLNASQASDLAIRRAIGSVASPSQPRPTVAIVPSSKPSSAQQVVDQAKFHEGQAWCEQCEMRVTLAKAQTCKSVFCKVRKAA